jgi:hypothetical protein
MILKSEHIPKDTLNLIFNQKIETNIIPDTVSYIYIGQNFNKDIEHGAIPKSVTKIIFGNRFNKSITYIFPMNSIL